MHKRKYFTKAVLTSTIFAVIPVIAEAGLVPIPLSGLNSGVLPDLGQGYDYALPGLTFTILDADNIGSTFIPLLGLNASVDSLLPVNNNETLNFAGGATVTATIGSSTPLGTINLQTANKTVNFQGNVSAGVINFAANAKANLSDTVIITANVDNTSGTAGEGTLQFQGGGQVIGNVGNTNSLQLITVNSAGSIQKSVELDGAVINVVTIHINDDGTGNSANGSTLKLNNAAMTLSANITANTNNEDILDITNAATLTGDIGANGQGFNLIRVGAQNNTSVNGNIFATLTQFQGNNTLSIGNGNIITGAVDSTLPGTGILQFIGSGQVTGNIGNNNAISTLQVNSSGGVGKQVELDGTVIKINTINTVGDGVNASTLLLNSAGVMALTGNIAPSNSNNLDILNIANIGNTTLSGNIGTSTKAFNLLKVGQNSDTTVNGNIVATTTQFQSNKTLSLSDGSIVTGNVDTIAGGAGTLQFLGGGRVSGNMGNANPLELISLNSLGGNKVVEFDGAVIKANAINIVGDGANATTLLLNSAGVMALTSDITTQANLIDVLNVANAGLTTIIGNIGGVGHSFGLIKVGQNANTSLSGNIFATLTQFQGNNVLAIGESNTITGNVDTALGGTGILQFDGSSRVTGNIGNTNALNLMILNENGGIKTIELDGAVVKANSINIVGDGLNPTTLLLNANGNMALTGNITTQGNLIDILNIANVGDTTMVGNIGGVGHAFDLIKLGQNANTKITGNIFSTEMQFQGDKILSLDNNSNLSGSVDTITPNTGTLQFLGNSTITGNVGNLSLAAVNLLGAGDIVNFQGNITAKAVNFSANATAKLSDGKIIDGSVDATGPGIGALQFLGAGQVTGNIGDTNAISTLLVNAGGNTSRTVELDGNIVKINTINTVGNGVNTTTLLLNSAGAMSLIGNISPSVSDNLDILNVANVGSTTITGNIGAQSKSFNLVKIGQNSDSTVSGNIFATTTQFQGNKILSFSDGSSVTGAVDTTVGGNGTLQFQGGGQVSGNIGNAAPLGLISLNSLGGTKTIELDGTVIKANAINIVGDGANPTTLLLNSPGAMALTGDITTQGNFIDTLNVVNAGVTTIVGNLGGIGHGFNLIQIGENADINITGNIFAKLTQFQGNHVLTLSPNSNIFGAIDSNAVSTGTLQFLGDSTVTGDIGDASLDAVNLLGAGSVVNFEGDVIASSVNFMADATANLSDGKVITGPVTTSLNDQGTLVFLGATNVVSPIGGPETLKLVSMQGTGGKIVNLNNNIFATNTSVNNGGTLFVNGSQTVNGNLSVINNSVLSLTTNANPLTVTGNFDLGTGTSFALNMGNLLAAGSVNALGIATVDAGSKVVITNLPVNIPGGKAVITIVTDGLGAGANLHVIPVTSNNLFTKFATEVNGNLLQLVITTNDSSGLQSNSNNNGNTGIINTVNALIGMDLCGTLEKIINQLGSFSDEQSLLEALKDLSPIVDGAVLFESFEAQRQAFDIVEERAMKVHYCKEHPKHYVCKRPRSGLSAGDWEYTDDGSWVKLFAYAADQGNRQDIDGYKDSMGGIAFGADTMFGDVALVGVAFSWSSLDIHHKGLDAKTNANSYQETLYGNYEFDSPWFLNWAAGIAYNSYNIDSTIMFGDLVLAPAAKFHGWQTGAKVEIGYDIENIFIRTIPLASLYYSHLDLSEYTQRGIDTADQQVNESNKSMLLAGVGVKFAYDYTYDNILYQPEAHMMTFYDFVGDQMEVTSQFVGAGPNFLTVGFKPARGIFNLGGSMNVFVDTGFIFSLQVDWNAKEDYNAFAGNIKLRYEW